MTDFSQSDINQITQHGLTPETVQKQIDDFKNGFPYANISRPATIGDGIIQTDSESAEKYADMYNNNRNKYTITKFVPASGAATRMFRDLFEYLTTNSKNTTTQNVLDNITQFAFYNELKPYLSSNPTDNEIISKIITSDGLNYGQLPKALITFHKYPDKNRTAAAEHLVEGAQYAESGNNVNIHFTISPEHTTAFNNLMSKIIPYYEQQFNLHYNITTSQQQSSTDTVAVTPNNELFRKNDGTLLFRPSGHGALINNLNAIDSDIIFIKNIDNVCHQDKRQDTIKYKQVLAGVLLDIQNHIFQYLSDIDSNNFNYDEIYNFILSRLNYRPQSTTLTSDELKNILNRPLRVCGVVKNTGAPGGGPFWTIDPDGVQSLQILESAQIAPSARDIMNQSTHFNPVDLVCSIRDYKGHKFDLSQFIDYKTGFISEKSFAGQPIRAMERPGLWNGAMAKWNTIFVEVPNTTFTPVKMVSDLLSQAHNTDLTQNA